MNIWISLVTGIIIGWVVEWFIDWLYWRRGLDAFYTAEAELRRELNQVKQDYQDALEKIADLSNRLSESQLNASAQNTTTQPPPSAPADGVAMSVDDLTRIRGIGNATEHKLIAAQITTFAQLAGKSPVQLKEIVGDPTADYSGWIEQARNLAREQTTTR